MPLSIQAGALSHNASSRATAAAAVAEAPRVVVQAGAVWRGEQRCAAQQRVHLARPATGALGSWMAHNHSRYSSLTRWRNSSPVKRFCVRAASEPSSNLAMVCTFSARSASERLSSSAVRTDSLALKNCSHARHVVGKDIVVFLFAQPVGCKVQQQRKRVDVRAGPVHGSLRGEPELGQIKSHHAG